MILILGICSAAYFAKKITNPIIRMNDAAREMAKLNFGQKVSEDRQDEIGELAHSINKMSAQLRDSIEAMEQDIQRRKQLGSLFKDLSHELKTPIAVIKGYADGLRYGVVEDTESREKYYRVISDECDKMNDMIKTLLEWSGLDRVSFSLELTAIHVYELIEKLSLKYNNVIHEKNCSIYIDGKKTIKVTADRKLLEHIFDNLLGNAVNAVTQFSMAKKERMCKEMKGKKLIWIMALVISVCIANLSVYEPVRADDMEPEKVLDGTEPIKPWDYQKLLGKGMDVDWCKTSKGKQHYNTVVCKNFKQSGVNHVRIRIKDTISDNLFKAFDKQVDDCLKYGLIPIIAYQADEFKNAPTEENIQKVVKWWGTVAERYQKKSYLMAFDLLIEATDVLNKQPEKLNEIYERIVTEVRKTNPERIIMISPRLRSDAAYLSELKIPSGHNGYLMAEWHFYAAGPSKTNPRKLWTTGTDAEKKLITDKIQLALEWQQKNQIPTWVGAWMAGDYNDGNHYSVEEQIVFASFMKQQLTQAGIPFAVNSDTKFYDREKNTWVEAMQPLFECIYGKKAIASKPEGSNTSSTTNIKLNHYRLKPVGSNCC